MSKNKRLLLWSFLMLTPVLVFASGNQVLRFLSNPVIGTFLLVLGFVGLVLEIFSPGFGPFAVMSLIGFGLFFASAFTVRDASTLPLILFVLGLIFAAIELMIPGFGLPGVAGIILIAAGVVFTFENIAVGLQAMSAAIIVTAIVVFFLVRAGVRSPMFDKVRLALNFTDNSGYVSTADKKNLAGQDGVAVTNLRPSGVAEILDKPVDVDVVTEGEFISKGDRITVVRVEGARIIVRRIA